MLDLQDQHDDDRKRQNGTHGSRRQSSFLLRSIQTLAKEMTLRVVAGKSQRGKEMALRGFVPFAAKLELSERGPVEWIRFKTIGIGDGMDLLGSPFWTMGVVNFLTAMGLFIGQPPAFLEMLKDLAAEADAAT